MATTSRPTKNAANLETLLCSIMCLRILYVSQNKQQLFPHTALTYPSEVRTKFPWVIYINFSIYKVSNRKRKNVSEFKFLSRVKKKKERKRLLKRARVVAGGARLARCAQPSVFAQPSSRHTFILKFKWCITLNNMTAHKWKVVPCRTWFAPFNSVLFLHYFTVFNILLIMTKQPQHLTPKRDQRGVASSSDT